MKSGEVPALESRSRISLALHPGYQGTAACSSSSTSWCWPSIYALIACGYVLIYRVSRVLNLAHGELMMLGAYLLLTTASAFSGNPLVAIAVAIVLSLLVGVLIYVFLMRKMTGEMVLAAVLTTVALGILLPRSDDPDLVGAAAISRAGAGACQSGAGAAGRRPHLDRSPR